jgi:hypothetical protein
VDESGWYGHGWIDERLAQIWLDFAQTLRPPRREWMEQTPARSFFDHAQARVVAQVPFD